MEAAAFIDALYAEAEKAGLKEFQICYDYRAGRSLSVFEGKPEKSDNDETQQIVFDVRLNGKIGKFVFEALPEAADAAEIVRNAVENATLISDKDDNFFYDGSGSYRTDLKPYQPLQDRLELLDKEDFLGRLEAAALAESPLVNKVIVCGYEEKKFRIMLRNSLGLDVSREGSGASAALYLSVKDGDEVKDALETVNFSREEDFNPKNLAALTVKKALDKLHAVDFLSGKTPVIINNKSFRMLLSGVATVASAQAVIEKMSKFDGKIGEKVAAADVTVIEDPFLDGGIRTKAFDGEGYPTQYKEIIKDGVLQTYLHNLKTAHRFGVTSTGNGKNTVTNLYLKPGKTSFEELLSELNEGILITELSGLHVGLDFVSGDFSVVGGGFEIKDGRIGKPLSQFTVAGNFYEVLKDIRKVGNDLDFAQTHIGSPSVWVENLTLSNK